MKNFVSVLLATAIAGSMSAVAFAGDAWDSSSANVSIVLSDARKPSMVQIPWNFKKSNYMQINGVGSFAAAQEILKPFGLYPVDIGNQTSLWSIFAAQHVKSTLQNPNNGGYNEVFITVLASADPNAKPDLSLTATSPTVPAGFGFFVTKIWVDDEAAKVAGNEIWGTNKDLAKIRVELNRQSKSISFSLNDVPGEATIALKMATPTQKGVADLKFYVYTRTKQIPTIFVGNGPATQIQLAPQNAGDASIQPKFGSTGWGAVLQNQVKFKAIGANFISSEDLQFGAPEDLPKKINQASASQ